jgi:6-pyruvoyltetrahydropterin/6-carboxytetrahydropterin synthase
MISADADIENLKNVKQMFEKLNIVTFQPTCENLLNHIAERVKKNLPPDISLHSIKLQETPTSYAEWYAEDQH